LRDLLVEAEVLGILGPVERCCWGYRALRAAVCFPAG